MPDSLEEAGASCWLDTSRFYLSEPTSREFGVFIFSKWLVEPGSLPLAVLSGMLGFGLLGSAIARFVRERAAPGGETAAVESSAGVFLRGLSATLVVYLGVKGGLAIFSLGDSEPNPYVLLLTCFVAAVFSENVWEAARRRLVTRLGLGEGTPGASQDRMTSPTDSGSGGNSESDA